MWVSYHFLSELYLTSMNTRRSRPRFPSSEAHHPEQIIAHDGPVGAARPTDSQPESPVLHGHQGWNDGAWGDA